MLKMIMVSLFGVALGFLEAIHKIYLHRVISSGVAEGSSSYLASLQGSGLLTYEQAREVGLVALILIFCLLAGGTKKEKFAYLLWTTSVYAVFRYIYLYLLVRWPDSAASQDLLLLLPHLSWTAPVFVTLLIVAGMIISSLFILRPGK